jgi:hypothetical protein
MTHYVENVGTDDVVFIEVLQADHFFGMSSSNSPEVSRLTRADVSVGQWLGLTPPQIVMDTLNLTNSTVSQFKEKIYIVPGAVVA